VGEEIAVQDDDHHAGENGVEDDAGRGYVVQCRHLTDRMRSRQVTHDEQPPGQA